jgi:cytoskeletal protein CcmA (bactofilin family)
MKATKFLFVMAMAAGLAACTKELVEPGKPVDSVIEEVKGAKVIANGFSINPNASDLQTKIAIQDGHANWTEGDVAGVAWFSDGKLTGDQTLVKLSSVKTYVSANHKLEWDGRFKSNSNVFEGWHIAYRPYVPMTKPADITGITVNPVLADNLNEGKQYELDRFENAPYFSGAHMVAAEFVEDGLINIDMGMAFVVNDLIIDLHVDPTFGEQIKALKVESIELSSSKTKPLFLTSLSVNPTKFPQDAPAFTAEHFGTSATAFYGTYVQTSKTEIAEENQANYTLGAGAGEGKFLRTRMFVAPVATYAPALAISDLSVKVNLSNGSYFTFKAPKDKESKNYLAFDKLHKLFTTGWTDDKNGKVHNLTGLDNDFLNIKFELTGADYKTTYTVKKGKDQAEDVANMNAVVAFAKEAGASSIALKFDSGVQIPYEAIVIEDEEMIINCSSSSKGATFIISDEQTWNPNIVLGSYMNVEVTETGDLTIENAFKVNNLTNEGILNVGDVAITAKTFTNEGTINVGAESSFAVATLPAGQIVRTVDGTETVAEINALIANTNLNTLNVTDVEWTGLDALADWTGVTVNMTSAKVSSTDAINVKALVIDGNENEVTCTTLTVTEPITIPAEADAEINADVVGAVVANGDLTVGNVSSTLTIANDVVVTAGTVKGVATIGDRAQVEAVAFAKGVTVGVDAVVTVKAAKVTSAAISSGLTIAERAKVTVYGKLSGASKEPISVAEGATLNVEGAVSATKGMTIGKKATVTIEGAVKSDLTIAEATAVNITGDVTGDVTVEATEVTIDGAVTGDVTVAEGSKLTVTGAITGAVTVAEGAVLEVKGVNGDLNVGKNAVVTVKAAVDGAVEVSEGAEFTVTGNITGAVAVAKNAEVAVTGNIAGAVTVAEGAVVTVTGDIAAAVEVAKGAEFTLNGNITSDVEVVIDGTATFKHTNMTAASKLIVNGNVTINTVGMDALRLLLGNVENNGTFTIVGGKYVFVENLDMEDATETSVKDGGILYYYNTVTLGGTTSGTIKKADKAAEAAGYMEIGKTHYVIAEDGLKNLIASADKAIEVTLEADVKLEAGTSMKSIKIDANGKKITFNKAALGELAITGTSVEISNATIETTGQTVGVYYEHALAFACPVKLTNVTTKTTILVKGDYDYEFNNVKFYDESDNYALYVYPNGQDIKINGCEFKCGRGINVEEINSIDAVKDTKLTVSGTKFTTQKKAAVKVHSAKKVEIVWSNNDISGVKADKENAVWIDERVTGYDYATATKYINNVVVTGATARVE